MKQFIGKALVEQILRKATNYEWSLQGFGMLRLHLPNNLRLHVWHSEFRAPNVSLVHDHMQWGFTSQIIVGELINHRYTEHPHGDPFLYTVLKPGYGCFFKTIPKPIQLRASPPERYLEGEAYAQSPYEIHRTEAIDGTVTIMHKNPTNDESARVFWREGSSWVSAEPRPATPEEVTAITQFALNRWFRDQP